MSSFPSLEKSSKWQGSRAAAVSSEAPAWPPPQTRALSQEPNNLFGVLESRATTAVFPAYGREADVKRFVKG